MENISIFGDIITVNEDERWFKWMFHSSMQHEKLAI